MNRKLTFQVDKQRRRENLKESFLVTGLWSIRHCKKTKGQFIADSHFCFFLLQKIPINAKTIPFVKFLFLKRFIRDETFPFAFHFASPFFILSFQTNRIKYNLFSCIYWENKTFVSLIFWWFFFFCISPIQTWYFIYMT